MMGFDIYNFLQSHSLIWTEKQIIIYLTEIIINILMLFPLGLLLPIALGSKSNNSHTVTWWHGVLIGFTVSLVIEILQYVTGVGFFQTADLIHNTVGCLAGFTIGKLLLLKKSQ